MADGTLIFDTKVDESGFNKGANSVKKQGKALEKSFGGLGKVLGKVFAVTTLIAFGKKAVELASDIQEVQNVVDTAFGDMAYKMEQFAETAIESFGMSKLTAKQTGSTFMAMAKGMDIAGESASDMAIQLTALAGDMSSFYNKSNEVTSTALKSVFTGETETLKQFGIVMTEVNLETFRLNSGIKTSYKNMTQAQKVQLRYNYVMEQTKLAQGDFLKTQGSWANQTRILSENFKELMSILGSGLVKVLTPVVQALNILIQKIIGFANSVAKVFGGQQLEAQNEQTKAVSGTVEQEEKLEEKIKDVTKANKKSLAGFDTIMKLSESIANNSGANGGSENFGISTPYDMTKINSIGNENGMFEDLDLSKLLKSLGDFRDELSRFGENLFAGLKWGYDNVIKPLGEFTITEVLPRFFETLSTVLGIFNDVIEELKPIFSDWFDNYVKPLAEFTGDKFIEFWDKVNEKLEGAREWIKQTEIFDDLRVIFDKLEKVMKPIVEALIDFVFWLGELVLDTATIEVKWFFEDLEDVIGAIASLINGDFNDAWKHLEDLFVNNRIEKAREQMENFRQKIEEVANNIKSLFTKENMEQAFYNIGVSFGKEIEKMLEMDKKIDEWVENNIKPLFTKEKWAEIFTNIASAMKETMENVLQWFTKEKWVEAGKNLYNGLAGNINSAIDGLQNLINGAISFFNKIIDGYNEIAEVNPLMDTIGRIRPVDLGKYKIPALANGTVVPANNGEFLAMLGDNKRETEVVSPLSTMKQAMREVMQELGGTDLNADIQIYWNGEEIYNQIEKVRARRGTRLVRGGI